MESGAAASTATEDEPKRPHSRKQNKQDQTKRHRSIFEVPADFFDSCRLLHPTLTSLPDFEISKEDSVGESKSEKEVAENNNSSDAKVMQRWSCNTCKAEFESLQDQRFHFKSDLHRFNIKLSIAGKSIIKEEDFDEVASDLLSKDYDVSSISGSDDEDERETSRQRELRGMSKSKIFIQLHNGERVSVWKCLLLNESENISFETDKSLVMDGARGLYLTQREVVEKLNYVIHEPRDNTRLRIVLLSKGGHFAGCVFDGNSLVAHKTFHRYVVRAKAGKKQSLKDAGGQGIHSAGASLRRYNELGLKKDIQELLTLWKPHFSAASCIFIHAPSNNRELFFDGEKPYFICQHRAIRTIPLTVRRPTLKEARRIYSSLVQISLELREEIAASTKQESLSGENTQNSSYPGTIEMELRQDLDGAKIAEACSLVTEMDSLSVSVDSDTDAVQTSTPLHEAAKSGNAQKVLELLEEGLDPCIKDERGQTPYTLANEKEVRNAFRRFMASNLEKWDWHAAKVPSPLTKEMEESQAAKQAEKDAKRKARAKELKKLRIAKEKKAQAEAAHQSHNNSSKPGSLGGASVPTHKAHPQSSSSSIMSKEEELKRIQDADREKRAAAAERRIAAMKSQGSESGSGSSATPSNLQSSNTSGSDVLCSCCYVSLAGKVPFHRYHYKYCTTSCMHLHREILEDG